MWISSRAFFLLFPITLILLFISRKYKENGDARYTRSVFFVIATLPLLIMSAIAIPSSPEIVGMSDMERFREEIIEIAEAVERYIDKQNSYPEDLNKLVKTGFIEKISISIPDDTPYFSYKINGDNDRKYFVIEYTGYSILLKGRILGPSEKCTELKYIQGKGLIVNTE